MISCERGKKNHASKQNKKSRQHGAGGFLLSQQNFLK
jgi:hypothetical protein